MESVGMCVLGKSAAAAAANVSATMLGRTDSLTTFYCVQARRPLASLTLNCTSLLPSRIAVHTYVSKPFRCRGRRKSRNLVIVATANAGHVLVIGEERKNIRSKRPRETKAVVAAVSCPTALLLSEDLVDVEGIAAVLELTYKDSLTAALESAYKQASLELMSCDLQPQYPLSPLAPSNDEVPANHVRIQGPKKRRTKLSKAAAGQTLNTEKLEAIRKPEKKILPALPQELAPLLENPEIRGKSKKRLDLLSRVALREKRRLAKKNPEASEIGSSSTSDYGNLWSDKCEHLINKYSSSLDLTAISWEKTDHVLLTAEEERALAFLMTPLKAMSKLRKSLRDEMASEPNDKDLASAARIKLPTFQRQLLLSNAARNKLIQHNLRLVLSQTHKYFKQSMGLSVFDLCQEGILGLIHGIDKFDPRKGYRLSTYAIYWIRNSILRAQTRSGHLLRTPFNVAAHKQSIKRTSMDLLMEKERAPTHKEVMSRLGLGYARYRNILQTSIRPGSMHTRCRITGKELVENLVDSEDRGFPTWKFSGDMGLRCGLDDVLDSLKPRESLVLRQRFGLDGKGERSLEEIGRNLNVSREMVRRYEMRALLKMKHPTRVEYLRGCLM